MCRITLSKGETMTEKNYGHILPPKKSLKYLEIRIDNKLDRLKALKRELKELRAEYGRRLRENDCSKKR
jgi:hypothetical protein